MATGATIFGIAYILVLVIPGVLFKTFYYKGKFAKQIASGLFADRILTTLFWGIAMQVISLLLFCLSFGISLGQFLDKATQYLNYLTSGRFPPISENDFMLIMQYVGMVVVFSIVIGLLSHWTIRTFKLDVKFENFKLTDHWYYLFSGEITEKISKRPTNGYKVVQTLVDVLVKENNGDCNLYTGLWAHHISTVKGELDTLYLIDVKKAKIQEDPEAVQAAGAEQPESTSKWEEVSGDFFIIPYSNVLNLNVRYVYINTRKKAKRDRVDRSATILGIWGLIQLSVWVFPWFLDISTLSKFLGILFSLITFAFGGVLINHIFSTKKADKINKYAVVIVLLSFLFFLYHTLRKFDVIPHYYEWLSR